MSIRILHIEDDVVEQASLARTFKKSLPDCVCKAAGSLADARSILAREHFDIIIADYFLEDGCASDLRADIGDIPLIMVTGFGNESIAMNALRQGAVDYLIKDTDRAYLEALPNAVEKAIQHRDTIQQLKLLGQTVENASDVIVITDAAYKIVFVNRSFEGLYGLTSSDVIGLNVADVFQETSPSGNTPQTNSQAIHDTCHRLKDGRIINVLVSNSSTVGGDGLPNAHSFVVRDVTRLRQAEEELISQRNDLVRQRDLLNAILDNSQSFIIVLDSDLRIMLTNQAVSDELGISLDQLTGCDYADSLVTPAGRERSVSAMRRLFEAGGPLVGDSDWVNAAGQTRTIHWNVMLVQLPFVEGACAVAGGQDVTEVMAAQKEMTRLSSALNQIGTAICVTDVHGCVEYINRGFTTLTGLDSEKAVGRKLKELDIFVLPSGSDELWHQVIDLHQEVTLESQVKRADQSQAWVQVTVSPVKDPHDLLEGFMLIVTNIMESREMQQNLLREKELLNVTVQSIRDGVISVDKDGHVVMVNRSVCEIIGLSEAELLGVLLQDVMHIRWEDSDEIIDVSLDQCKPTASKSVFGQVTLTTSSEKELLLQLDMNTLHDQDSVRTGAVLVFRDVTKSEQIDRELRRMNKLESISLLAGGIAHDFRNILTPVLGDISMVKESLAVDDPLAVDLTHAERGCQRAANLATQLLIFARGGSPVRHPMNLTATAMQAGEFATSGSSCRVTNVIDPELWAVEADEGQVFQILHNLIINARIALGDQGEVQLRINNTILAEDEIPLLKAGRYVKIEVEDNGPGISPDVMPLIFDPFFTTRPDGRGLGLAIVYSVVRNHDGIIQVDSEVGERTTFTVYLPATDMPSSCLVDTNAQMVRGTGRILMMDDELPILEFMTKLVSKLGYEPVTTENGEQAIARYKAAMDVGNPFNLVIMDLTIPGGMGGRETIKELLRIDPEVRAIVASGYSNDPILSDPATYGFKGAITKPFRIKEMSALIANVLQA
ncbi:MAG: PAS domain S-box protein [Armatimonadota bacterium]